MPERNPPSGTLTIRLSIFDLMKLHEMAAAEGIGAATLARRFIEQAISPTESAPVDVGPAWLTDDQRRGYIQAQKQRVMRALGSG